MPTARSGRAVCLKYILLKNRQQTARNGLKEPLVMK